MKGKHSLKKTNSNDIKLVSTFKTTRQTTW